MTRGVHRARIHETLESCAPDELESGRIRGGA